MILAVFILAISKRCSIDDIPYLHNLYLLYRQESCYLCLFVVHSCENPFPCLIPYTKVLTTTFTVELSKILSASLFGKHACLLEPVSLYYRSAVWRKIFICFHYIIVFIILRLKIWFSKPKNVVITESLYFFMKAIL